LVKSVHSMMIAVKNIHFLYAKMTGKNRTGHKLEVEKERLSETEERVRQGVAEKSSSISCKSNH
jgi:hypothetical protein